MISLSVPTSHCITGFTSCVNQRRTIPRSAAVVVAAALLMALCLLPTRVRAASAVRMIAFDYPPFFMEQDDVLTGIAVDVSREVFARLGLDMETRLYPLKRGLSHLEHGDYDGVAVLIKTDERSRYLVYSRPVLIVRGLIWSSAARGRPVNFDRLRDLADYTVGVTRGYSYGQEFDDLLETMDVDAANSDYLNYVKLMDGRIDIFPGNEIVARGLFRKHPELRGKFVHSERSFIEWPLCMALSKESEFVGLLPEINRILTEMEASGFIDAVVRKHTE